MRSVDLWAQLWHISAQCIRFLWYEMWLMFSQYSLCKFITVQCAVMLCVGQLSCQSIHMRSRYVSWSASCSYRWTQWQAVWRKCRSWIPHVKHCAEMCHSWAHRSTDWMPAVCTLSLSLFLSRTHTRKRMTMTDCTLPSQPWLTNAVCNVRHTCYQAESLDSLSFLDYVHPVFVQLTETKKTKTEKLLSVN